MHQAASSSSQQQAVCSVQRNRQALSCCQHPASNQLVQFSSSKCCSPSGINLQCQVSSVFVPYWTQLSPVSASAPVTVTRSSHQLGKSTMETNELRRPDSPPLHLVLSQALCLISILCRPGYAGNAEMS
jgi:hypothetical protein